ncbi:unnamed protein product [Mytilus coruscus]|uniref:Uncharacterized protein n=1 Tax=Mytilus coruscus TaxID=42192 RepID=A0A6J8EKS7_MYTCO|nr:unnamed protein product [Mytilus coruscus]
MAKRKAETLNDDEISGYLVEVSPIKTSQQNNKYFDVLLTQIEKRFNTLSALTLANIVNSDQQALRSLQTSSLNVLRSLDFSCKEQPKETSEQCTLEKIQNLPEKSKVTGSDTVFNNGDALSAMWTDGISYEGTVVFQSGLETEELRNIIIDFESKPFPPCIFNQCIKTGSYGESGYG